MSDIIEESKHRISDKIKKDPTPVIGINSDIDLFFKWKFFKFLKSKV